MLFPLLGIFLVTRALFHVFRNVARDETVPRIDRPPRTYLGRPKTVESRVYTLAYRLGGRVTLSDVIMETGLGMEDA